MPLINEVVEPRFARILYLDVNTQYGEDQRELLLSDIHAVNGQIFNIFTTIKGERPFEPEFGSQIPFLIFDPVDSITAYRIESEMYDGVAQWLSERIILDHANSRVTPLPDFAAFDAAVAYILRVSQIQVTLNLRFQA